MFRKTIFGVMLLMVGACGDAEPANPTVDPGIASTTQMTEFPVSVSVGGVEVTLEARPQRIVSLSPTATETLFAIGAGDQVVAADEFSNYPAEAPTTELSGFTPNIEAIASYEPDMIVITFDPDSLISESFGTQGVAVLPQFPAQTRAEMLAQIDQLGALTGHVAEAAALRSRIAERWDKAVTADAGGASIYVEVDSTFYAASTSSFLGAPLSELGFQNIADAADSANSGFPQLNAEAILEANPDVIVIGTQSGLTPEDIASRPGWDVLSAVINDRIVVIDSDISSRWGPRFVEYVESMSSLAKSLVGVAS